MTRADAKSKEWTPHIWEGCEFFAWLRLLARGRCAVHPAKLYVAVIVTFVSLVHTLLKILENLLYGRRIRATSLKEAPLFIVGHWRTGTTLLHELLILDDRHAFPNTYQCLEPNHFLLTEGFFTRWLWFLMPSRRPMDNMAAGWSRPQEDEFALCMLGQPSPYLSIAFPNREPVFPEYLDLVGLSRQALASWKRDFLFFLRHLTFKDPRRLVLKSPTHTARLPVLRELFPEAKFIHIVRDPFVVFPSTVNLWKSLYATHGLQKPRYVGLEEHVFQTFTRMYERLEEGKRLLPSTHFVEVRYEDLLRDPCGALRRLYGQLGLGDFERVEPKVKAYLEANAGYQTNRYPQLAPELRAEIARRWASVIERYGYGKEG